MQGRASGHQKLTPIAMDSCQMVTGPPVVERYLLPPKVGCLSESKRPTLAKRGQKLTFSKQMMMMMKMLKFVIIMNKEIKK